MGKPELLTLEDLHGDVSAERRAEWERLALARAVANALVTYRGEHGLSQRALATKLGVRPSVVARLELAEHNPTTDTLRHLSAALGLRIALEVVPPGQEAEYLDESVGRDDERAADRARVLIAVTA